MRPNLFYTAIIFKGFFFNWREILQNYNYEVKGTGEVITFVGLYAANKGQAAAVTFYTFVSESQ